MGVWLLAPALAVGALIIWAFRVHSRRSLVKGREPKSLADLQAEVPDQVSPDVFREVWTTIGEAFSIDARLIRPNDTLAALTNMASWDLGNGEDALSEWFEKEGWGRPPAPATVLDLARWVQSCRARTEHCHRAK